MEVRQVRGPTRQETHCDPRGGSDMKQEACIDKLGRDPCTASVATEYLIPLAWDAQMERSPLDVAPEVSWTQPDRLWTWADPQAPDEAQTERYP